MIAKALGIALISTGLAFSASSVSAEELSVKITAKLASVTVKHDGKDVVIMRNQDKDHTINPMYVKTSRHCPPFCISPISAHPGVETIGELEVLDYLGQASKGENVLVVDSRTPEWMVRGTIPGSVNIPWLKISPRDNAPFETSEVDTRDDILGKQFGASKKDGKWDFGNARTLVMFCNGIWCEQSLHNIRTLIELGYPTDKLKWYRGGMQDWEMLGLTTLKTRH
jgi:rhodanese-related sulfurtransferase